MNVSYKRSQLLLLLNQFLVIIYLCYQYVLNPANSSSNIIQLTIATMMIISLSYIKITNVKNNAILSEFTDLLMLFSWQLLVIGNDDSIYFLEMMMNVLVLYKLFQFILLFIFQDQAYKKKREIEFTLKGMALISLISIVNVEVFSIAYFFQWIINIGLLILAIMQNRKRVFFFLTIEYRNLINSFVITIIPFSVYIISFNDGKDLFTNLAFYFIFIFPLYSVYLIVKKNKSRFKKGTRLNTKKELFLCIVFIIFLLVIGNILNVKIAIYFIIVHSILWFIIMYFILFYSQVKVAILSGDEKQNYPSYINSIIQVSKEEQLKKDFSDFLHDEILQDLLAVKNIVYKADKVEIKEIIVETLNQLSSLIRRQTEEYHPTILKTITLKENYSNLIKNIKRIFGMHYMQVSFICEEDIFLIEPYNIVIYRFIKELTTNCFKHSQADHIWIYLYQEMEIVELIVKDNGVGEHELDNFKKGHKGLTSIREQVNLLGGEMEVSSEKLSGLKVRIKLSMKGDYSFEHFIN